MKFRNIAFFIIIVFSASALLLSCSKTKEPVKELVKDPVENDKPISNLPTTQAKIYIGIANRWHDMDNPANYSKWEYVRSNADGFYTNFINMWINSYQNPQDPQLSCTNMSKAFVKKGCFFETSLETKLNDSPEGGNNEATDKKYIDLLINGGFTIDYTSLNYGIEASRVNTLKTYRGKRHCLALIAPWMVGGDISKDSPVNNSSNRQDINDTDGFSTDGPLGFWGTDFQQFKEGSISMVKYGAKYGKITSTMLAPFDVENPDYNSTTDFFDVSKQYVFYHEDNNASPEVWSIWTYGEKSDHPTFPESVNNPDGTKSPANTLTGVGYWLIKHLNNFPKLIVNEAETPVTGVSATRANDSTTAITFAKTTNTSYPEFSFPIKISNSNDPAIEISPVIQAVVEGIKDWDIRFEIGGKDVSEEMIYKGGINFIKNLRISKDNNTSIQVFIKPNKSNPSPVKIRLKAMSNISNTKNIKDVCLISAS